MKFISQIMLFVLSKLIASLLYLLVAMEKISRRQILKFGLCAAVAIAVPAPVFARADFPVKKLAFYNIHTGEKLRVVFRENGEYIPEALTEINHLLRDFRTSDIHKIDPKLLDQLHTLQQLVESEDPFHVISGYRSPETNNSLAAKSKGVAKHSFHMQGRAIDICLPGKDLSTLRKAAMSIKNGGVGFYPARGFIHVDTGPVRHWG